jgi:hypothetical protein
MNTMNANNGSGGALAHFILESQASADNTLNHRPPINLTNPHKNRLLLNKSKSTGTSVT